MAGAIGRSPNEAGKRIIEGQARRQVRTFLDELRNGTRNYRTVASLGGQVAQEYRGRAILERLQNAHDVLAFASEDDPWADLLRAQVLSRTRAADRQQRPSVPPGGRNT